MSTGKNFATSSVLCVNVKFEPSAGAETVELNSALTPLARIERVVERDRSARSARRYSRLYGDPVLTLAIDDAAMPNEPP